MTNAVDRITSYDFLGIFVPGSVGLAMIVAKWFPNLLIENPKIICCGCKIMSENTTLMTTIQMLMFFAGAYVLGLIINWISDGIWRGFRNNSAFFELQALKLIQRNPGYRYIVCEFYIEPSDRNELWYFCKVIRCLKKMFCDIWEKWTESFRRRPPRKYPWAEIKYYKIYYWLLERNKISSVSVMESQVTLLRNLLLPSFFGFFMIPCLHIEEWQLFLMCLSIFFTMVSRQNRIYSIILEDYQNYKEKEVNHGANSNNHN